MAIFRAPHLLEVNQCCHSLFAIGRSINLFHIDRENLHVLRRQHIYKSCGSDAQRNLGGRLRKDGADGIGKAVQVIETVIRISSMPRAFKSVRVLIQNDEDSVLPTHIPSTSLYPIALSSIHRWTVLFMTLPGSLT